MAEVPEDTLNHILKGIDATNFNAVVLSRIDKMDKVVARHIQSAVLFWFGMGGDFVWTGLPDPARKHKMHCVHSCTLILRL